MSDFAVLYKVQLQKHHVPTGKTRHYSGGRLLPPPQELQIVKLAGGKGYYLLYFNEKGEEMTDTFHEEIQGAMDQAEHEFNVTQGDWKVVTQSDSRS